MSLLGLIFSMTSPAEACWFQRTEPQTEPLPVTEIFICDRGEVDVDHFYLYAQGRSWWRMGIEPPGAEVLVSRMAPRLREALPIDFEDEMRASLTWLAASTQGAE